MMKSAKDLTSYADDTVQMLRDVAKWRELISEYGGLRSLNGHTPQFHGQPFNELIVELLRCRGIEATASVRTIGEVDVVFVHSGARVVLEAKWQKVDTGNIAKLQNRVRKRIARTCGFFLPMSGYSLPMSGYSAEVARPRVASDPFVRRNRSGPVDTTVTWTTPTPGVPMHPTTPPRSGE